MRNALSQLKELITLFAQVLQLLFTLLSERNSWDELQSTSKMRSFFLNFDLEESSNHNDFSNFLAKTNFEISKHKWKDITIILKKSLYQNKNSWTTHQSLWQNSILRTVFPKFSQQIRISLSKIRIHYLNSTQNKNSWHK